VDKSSKPVATEAEAEGRETAGGRALEVISKRIRGRRIMKG
jgi:hypothetical protein